MVQHSDQAQAVSADQLPGSTGPDQRPTPEIDLQALAQKVYDLLKRELRLEHERLGPAKFR